MKDRKGLSWTAVEDKALIDAVKYHQALDGRPNHLAHKANWNKVATSVKGRTAGACQARWNVHLDPTVDRSPWTPELDAKLLELFKDKRFNSWSKRALALAEGKTNENGDPMRRSGADCCTRYFELRPKSGSKSKRSSDGDEGESMVESAEQDSRPTKQRTNK